MHIKDTFSLAYRTIRSNKLRTGITIAIIAFGIMALIGILTAIDAMKQSLKESFSTLGANAFSIRYKEKQFKMGGPDKHEITQTKKNKGLKQRQSTTGLPISYEQALQFKQRFAYTALVSISLRGPNAIKIKTDKKETNPNVSFIGGDEEYVALSGYTIAQGRNLSRLEVEAGASVCLLGNDVAVKLFGTNTQKAMHATVRIGTLPYSVIGVLESKGSSAFLNADNIVITNYNNMRRLREQSNSFNISIMVKDVHQMDMAIGEATGLFRSIRGLKTSDTDNFYIDKSDSLAQTFINLLGNITLAAAAIGFITLIGAAIGLMNIMLVAVTERTKEVGLVKALGGRSREIRIQFLVESLLISLMGAAIGIVLGVGVGNIFALVLQTGFVLPWQWIALGIAICSIVGLAAGLYPAIKASKLNPIEALRYE